MTPSVFEFSNSIEFLRAVLLEKRKKNRLFSIRAWARQLGMNNPTSLSRILRGVRALGPDLAKKLAEKLELNPDESGYFQLLAAAEQNGIDFKSVKPAMDGSKRVFHDMSPDEFLFISEWHHMAILEMTTLKGFRSDSEWISRRLSGKVSPPTCEEAVSRLARLGLISLSRSGKIKREKTATLKVNTSIRSVALLEFHRQAIAKATEAIDAQTSDTRHLSTATIGIKKTDFDDARKIIIKAHDELTALARNSESDEIYQISTQLFQVTAPIRHESNQEISE